MRKVTTVHYEPPVRTLNGWDMKIAGMETKIEQEECDMVNNNLMSRENKIEEMAALIYQNRPIKDIWNEDADSIAQTLYNAGYRKQNDEELIDKIATYFEKEDNWTKLKYAWNISGKSAQLRNMLRDAITEAKMKGGAE